MEYVTLHTVIIVGAVCSLVVLVLMMVLVVLCCKRCHTKSLYEKERNSAFQMAQPLNNTSNSYHINNHFEHERQNGNIPASMETNHCNNDNSTNYNLHHHNNNNYNSYNNHTHQPLSSGEPFNYRDAQLLGLASSNRHHSLLSINHPQKRIIYEVVV